jgi:hypothetical protein
VDVTLRFVPGKGDLEALPVRFAAMQARFWFPIRIIT